MTESASESGSAGILSDSDMSAETAEKNYQGFHEIIWFILIIDLFFF